MLTDEQRHRYEETRRMAKEEMEQIDKEIEVELSRVKERLLELQTAKKAIKQIYDGACSRLGVKSSLEIKDMSFTDFAKNS